MVHAAGMVLHHGTTQTSEGRKNPDSEHLKELPKHLRPYEAALAYAPNQVYIGNMTPMELKETPRPWYEHTVEAKRDGKYGEILPEDEFLALMKMVDTFDLVALEGSFQSAMQAKIAAHPVLSGIAGADKLGKDPAEAADIRLRVEEGQAQPMYFGGALVGCVKKAHEFDEALSDHVMFENLVGKASSALALALLIHKTGLDPGDVEYIIECSEEACGDMNQRGGGNFAKSIGELCGCVNATGSDTRSFCAGPAHALVEAAALAQSGVYKNIVVLAGGSSAKLGMNSKDHVKKGLPVLEDMLGAFAIHIGENDGVNPVIRTDGIGRHRIGSGSSPQAVVTAIVAEPLDRMGYHITDVDLYSPELQNPEITEPAGAGNVPLANYKMIGALGVMRGEIPKPELLGAVESFGMTGFAPTQGHIPSGVPAIGYLRDAILAGRITRGMVIGKGSLFLGRLTNLFDGVSLIVEKNPGPAQATVQGGAAAPGDEEDEAAGAGGGAAQTVGSAKAATTGDVANTGGAAVGNATVSATGMAPGDSSASHRKKIRIGVVAVGSELGENEVFRGAALAQGKYEDVEVVLVGGEAIGADGRGPDVADASKQAVSAPRGVKRVPAADEKDAHARLDAMMDAGELDGAVAMHYSFPIGVSTVGRALTPGTGREMYLACTTGTSATQRTAAMVRNAIAGIAVAKACGLAGSAYNPSDTGKAVCDPTVGILNLDNARQAQRALLKLQENGYPITFATSDRADGGSVMRGNDLLTGAPDVMVCDSLTGNVLMKMFSAFNTGGSYEAMGFGYGPGVGDGYDRIVCIVSRASGAPVIANAVRFAADCVKGNLPEVAKGEFAAARGAGLEAVPGAPRGDVGAGGSAPDACVGIGAGTIDMGIASTTDTGVAGAGVQVAADGGGTAPVAPAVAPPKKVLTKEISGVEIMEIEDAVQALWKLGIYAESGMGCTGPVVMVAKEDCEAAEAALKGHGYL
jgi:betaine reductase